MPKMKGNPETNGQLVEFILTTIVILAFGAISLGLLNSCAGI